MLTNFVSPTFLQDQPDFRGLIRIEDRVQRDGWEGDAREELSLRTHVKRNLRAEFIFEMLNQALLLP